jgi:hypothetical protein
MGCPARVFMTNNFKFVRRDIKNCTVLRAYKQYAIFFILKLHKGLQRTLGEASSPPNLNHRALITKLVFCHHIPKGNK